MALSNIRSALCLFLCPLLAATSSAAEVQQQPSVAASPPAAVAPLFHTSLDFVKGRRVQLVAVDPVAIEAVAQGAPFQFVVDKDVAVGGITVIHAGTPVLGVVARVNRGNYEKSRDGFIDLRLSQPDGEKPVVVRLGGIAPEQVYQMGNYGANRPSLGQIVVPLVLLGIVVLALLGGDN